MFSRFFIDRPIFAAVLSVFIMIAGLASMRVLPIAQYPEIAPPVVTVQAIYPGASAEVMEQTVAAPLENQITGVEKMIYMSSTSGSNGITQIQVSFDIGANADQAALDVNNRVKQAEPRLPEEVRRQGVTVQKGSSAFLQVLAFYSPDGRYDNLFISNYVTLNVLDELKRVPGTTNVQIFGAKDYAMRTGAPGPSFISPSTITRSPGFRPPAMIQSWPFHSPACTGRGCAVPFSSTT
jgi:multidrug efflux pump subunit AcrB